MADPKGQVYTLRMDRSDGQRETKLSKFLLERGIKPVEFARAMGESPQTVNNWLRNKMPIAKAVIAATKFKVKVSDLVDTPGGVIVSTGIGAGKAIAEIYSVADPPAPYGLTKHGESGRIEEEEDLVKNFRQLDKSGRYAVLATLYRELERQRQKN